MDGAHLGTAGGLRRSGAGRDGGGGPPLVHQVAAAVSHDATPARPRPTTTAPGRAPARPPTATGRPATPPPAQATPPSGSHTRNTVPFPSSLSTSTRPPWFWAMRRTMARPRPVPPFLVE